ncbi:MAG: hypothetical protein ACI4MP_01410 [Candidatus Ventricola sp.]
MDRKPCQEVFQFFCETPLRRLPSCHIFSAWRSKMALLHLKPGVKPRRSAAEAVFAMGFSGVRPRSRLIHPPASSDTEPSQPEHVHEPIPFLVHILSIFPAFFKKSGFLKPY